MHTLTHHTAQARTDPQTQTQTHTTRWHFTSAHTRTHTRWLPRPPRLVWVCPAGICCNAHCALAHALPRYLTTASIGSPRCGSCWKRSSWCGRRFVACSHAHTSRRADRSPRSQLCSLPPACLCVQLGIAFEFVNIGGGLGVPYRPDEVRGWWLEAHGRAWDPACRTAVPHCPQRCARHAHVVFALGFSGPWTYRLSLVVSRRCSTPIPRRHDRWHCTWSTDGT